MIIQYLNQGGLRERGKSPSSWPPIAKTSVKVDGPS